MPKPTRPMPHRRPTRRAYADALVAQTTELVRLNESLENQRALTSFWERFAAEQTKRLDEKMRRREPGPASSAMQDDMNVLMEVLGISTHARPVSPHEVMVNEVIPCARALRHDRREMERMLRDLGVTIIRGREPQPWETTPGATDG